MATARVFKSGNSQAVRLPKKFRAKSSEVEILIATRNTARRFPLPSDQ
jgi:virulence-associated protein VagC